MTESEQFGQGVALFNAGKFFEAHEVWEELWLGEAKPEKAFLQGLIQLAAAFHHHSRGNPRGATSLLAAGLAKLRSFQDDHRGIALGELRAEAEHWTGKFGGRENSEAERLPRIRFANERAEKKPDG